MARRVSKIKRKPTVSTRKGKIDIRTGWGLVGKGVTGKMKAPGKTTGLKKRKKTKKPKLGKMKRANIGRR